MNESSLSTKYYTRYQIAGLIESPSQKSDKHSLDVTGVSMPGGQKCILHVFTEIYNTGRKFGFHMCRKSVG